MLSPQALIRGVVSRIIPPAAFDNPNVDVPQVFGRYGEARIASYIRKAHLLADEGSYYVAANGQTAITGQTTTAFTATSPSLLISNTDSATNPLAKRIYLDYIHLLNGGTAYSNATSNTGIFWHLLLDTGNRYTSGGTALTIASPNMDLSQKSSVALVNAGAITASAATNAVRTIVGQRFMRAPVSGTALTLANLDEFHFNFGGVESHVGNFLQASATLEANMVNKAFAGPAVIIGPGQSLLFYINCIAGGAVTAGNLIYEVGWWER
jgi:hypothetical protein